MNVRPLTNLFLLTGVMLSAPAIAQEKNAPVTLEEREAAYATAIQHRSRDIVVLLNLTDAAKSNKVADIILSQYRLLRTRDDTIEAMVKLMAAEGPAADQYRTAFAAGITPSLHEQFLLRLAGELTPEQIETVKDKMTYHKVKVTFDAYCAIVPNLTESNKVRIVELLKRAREEAIDGGSAGEKSRIFQKYKDQINAYLDAQGHNVTQAYKDWEARQANPSNDSAAK